MAGPLTSTQYVADFLKVNISQEYTLESHSIKNSTGAAITLDGIPYPVKTVAGGVEVMTALESATPANIVGYIVTNRHETIPAAGTSMAPYAILTRGMAVVDKLAYAPTDLAGAAYDAADFDTFNAAAAPPIIGRTIATALTSEPIYNS